MADYIQINQKAQMRKKRRNIKTNVDYYDKAARDMVNQLNYTADENSPSRVSIFDEQTAPYTKLDKRTKASSKAQTPVKNAKKMVNENLFKTENRQYLSS